MTVFTPIYFALFIAMFVNSYRCVIMQKDYIMLFDEEGVTNAQTLPLVSMASTTVLALLSTYFSRSTRKTQA